eukprot:TRINITY_DN10703_c0_g1_i1.p1 TRINITY_DN10703_c0_g1~~TRINITY_DN10703_c0_g1_i1.p1  ORF type:complete len:563 (-),score=101.04 TRINITY_DN10703_c0_g1_i1:931-2529(-)
MAADDAAVEAKFDKELEYDYSSDDEDHARLHSAENVIDVGLSPTERVSLPDIVTMVPLTQLPSDLWTTLLNDDDRARLLPLLPAGMNPASASALVRDLLSGKNFDFGSPLTTFQRRLVAGEMSPAAVARRADATERLKNDSKAFVRAYHNWMVIGFHGLRKQAILRDGERRLADTPQPIVATRAAAGIRKRKADPYEGELPKKSPRKKSEVAGPAVATTATGEKAEKPEKPSRKRKVLPAAAEETEPDPGDASDTQSPHGSISFIAIRNNFWRAPAQQLQLSVLESKTARPRDEILAALRFLVRPSGGQSLVVLLGSTPEDETWQWVGKLNDSSDAAMLTLENAFRSVRGLLPLSRAASTPQDPQIVFRRQERRRYRTNGAFMYIVGGMRTMVAPAKRTAGARPRDHPLLRPERPSSVSLLSIVRDGTCRLPVTGGSRQDVVGLVRQSQYLVDNVDDQRVHQVVSGALDRLHSEEDPCVKYESERKLWLYLHANRGYDEFPEGTGKKIRVPRKKDAAAAALVADPSFNEGSD